MRNSYAITIFTISLTVFAGCGGGAPDDAPDLAAVSGKVTVDGKAVSGLTVEFHPTGDTKGPLSTGTTGEDGSFTLATSTGRAGAVIGSHKVLVKCPWRLEGRAKAGSTADGFGSSESGVAPPPDPDANKKCTVNEKFEAARTTTLSAEVPPAGVNDLLLQASSK